MEQLNNLKEQSAEVRLLRAEKDAMKSRILARPVSAPVGRTVYPSPYLPYLRGLAGAFALFILVLIPATYAAQKSSPGDPLYDIELSLVEPVEEIFQVGHENQIAYHTDRLTERLTELKSAQEDGAATSTIATLTESASEHANEVRGSVAVDLPSANSIASLVSVSAILEAQEEILENLDAETEEFRDVQIVLDDALEENNRAFAKTAEPEEIQTLISNELAKTSAAATMTMSLSAENADDTRLAKNADDRLERLQEELDDEDYGDALDIMSSLRIEFLKKGYLAEDESEE